MWNPFTIPFFAQKGLENGRMEDQKGLENKPEPDGRLEEPLATHPTTHLTWAQQEALHLLAEECGEVVQACTKILRHGLVAHEKATNPDTVIEHLNIVKLNQEVGHVVAAAHICNLLGLLDGEVQRSTSEKLKRVQSYLHHIKLIEGPAK